MTATVQSGEIVLPGTYPVYVNNPSPGGYAANFINFTVTLGTYPVPGLSYLFPSSALAGSLPFTLNAGGYNFAPDAVLNFNGVPKVTSYNGSQQLSTTITAADIPISKGGTTVQVTVTNPSHGGGTSANLPFDIVMPNPIPTITSISPTSGSNGSSNPITLTINGTNFQGNPTVYFNGGGGQGASLISSTQISVLLYLGGVSSGTYPIVAVDPYPGGTSNAVNFTVTGPPDFSITSSGATTQTVSAGQSATFTNAVTIAPQNGFASPVNLSCFMPFAATATTCSATPNSFATGSGTATVTVTTTKRGLLPPSQPPTRFFFHPQLIAQHLLTMSLAMLLAMLLAVLLLRLSRTRRQRFALTLPFAFLVLFLFFELAGCGGGGGSSPPPPPPPPAGTPAGTYTVTVSATSGATSHTSTLTLTVN